MRVLLDTHAFLWAIVGDPRLGDEARDRFLDPACSLFLSAASAWEIAIKEGLGKVVVRAPLRDLIEGEMRANSIAWQPIDLVHCVDAGRLPFHHRDPFDRMLAAQALREQMVLMSVDTAFDAYAVRRIW